jgi:hypothetical protein
MRADSHGLWRSVQVRTVTGTFESGSGRRNERAMTDDVSIEELQKAVEQMHGVPTRFVESVEVDERHQGKLSGNAP